MSDDKKIETNKNLLKQTEKLSDKKTDGSESTLAELIDEATYESPSVSFMSLPAIIADLDVPSQNTGPFSEVDKQRWLLVIENMLVRGVKSAREVSRLTGLSVPTASKFVNNVKDSLSNDLTISRINTTRELLYAENQTIADFCWNIIRQDPTDNRVPQFLKIIGDTNSRRGRLMGLESVGINVSKTESTEAYDPVKSQKMLADKLGINPEALKNLADNFADHMNVIDAEFEETENKNDRDDKKDS